MLTYITHTQQEPSFSPSQWPAVLAGHTLALSHSKQM